MNSFKGKQLSRLSDELDSHGSKRPWDTAEWKERRRELLADECEWCSSSGEDTTLQLHHYEEPEFDWEKEWIQTEDTLFVQSDTFDSTEMVDDPENCPNCYSSNMYARKTKNPTYRCRRCEYEFPDADGVRIPDLIAAQYASVYAGPGFYKAKLNWVKKNAAKIRRKFKERYEKHWEEYLSLKETITICRSCHYQHHHTSKKRCERCEGGFGRYDSDYGGYLCFDCVIDEKGLAVCLECGDNWHNPSKTNACSDCR